MIDQSLRSQGIGASEIAGIVGLDPRRTPFSIWAEKTHQLTPPHPTPRMLIGKKVERLIADLYAEETGHPVRWLDITYQHPERKFQLCTPDAMTESGDRIVECKNVAIDQARQWGDEGTDQVPDAINLQTHWQMSCMNAPRVDVAAFFGGNDLKIFTVWQDRDIEAVLLERAEEFWQRYVIGGQQPELGAGEAARRYLLEKFPRHVTSLREATAGELEVIGQYREADVAYEAAKLEIETIENKLKLAIGDAEGLKFTGGKITWKRCKDTMGTDWEAVSAALLEKLRQFTDSVKVTKGGEEQILPLDWFFPHLASRYQIVTRAGTRKFLPKFEKEKAA